MRKKTAYTVEQWKEIIADWEKSEVSMNAYCIRNKLCPISFCRWKKKIQQSLPSQLPFNPDKAPPVNLEDLLQDFFVPVTENVNVPPTSFLGSQKLEIMFAQGHRFYLNGHFDWEKLSSWLTPLLTDPSKKPLEAMDFYDNKNKLS